MINLVITAPHLDTLTKGFMGTRPRFPRTAQALNKASELVAEQWKRRARNPRQTHAWWFAKQYADSITTIKEATSRDLFVDIGPVGKGAGAAHVVEDGRDEYDMKPALLKSQRAKRSKKGVVYTIIGFRHSVESVEQAGISVDDLPKMEKVGTKRGRNRYGKFMSENRYDYSQRERRQSGATSSVLDNLYRTEQPVGKDRSSGKTQTQAVNFRVVTSEMTEGWMFPAIKAENISEIAFRQISQNSAALKDIISMAIKEDMLEMLDRL